MPQLLTEIKMHEYVNYYKILGIKITATQEEIKQAFKQLAMRFHPDRNQDPSASVMMVKLNAAYNVLVDPIKRGEYDVLCGSRIVQETEGPPMPKAPNRFDIQLMNKRGYTICPSCQGVAWTRALQNGKLVLVACRSCGGQGFVVKQGSNNWH